MGEYFAKLFEGLPAFAINDFVKFGLNLLVFVVEGQDSGL